jgi:N-acetylglucosaminyldiphosphoundecaprenol N-acetyl-beta-D-mannosaminyltransferase
MSASEAPSGSTALALRPESQASIIHGSATATPAVEVRDVPLVSVGGMAIAVIDRKQSAELMVRLALARRGSRRAPAIITSANGQVISMCAQDKRLRELFAAADLIHADGMPLVFASRLKCRRALPERVATTDLFHDVARLAEAEGASFYLLGGADETIEAAVGNVRAAYPELRIAGFRSGYFGLDQEDRVIADINAARPDILWVGMGVPREQTFCLRHRERLCNVGVIKTSGGLFVFLSGRNRRAPAWMQSAGLEWLYRVGLEPRRLFRRYLVTNPHALFLLAAKPSRVVREGAEAGWGS